MENLQINENKTIKNIMKGTGIALITTVLLLLIFSIILTYFIFHSKLSFIISNYILALPRKSVCVICLDRLQLLL